MVVFNCKMCGGDLNIIEGKSVCMCEYCGTKQTVPYADNEKKVNAFNRANHLRSSCEFDKAAGVYETIISEFLDEAEAYWGLILCKYGIEYVDDPATSCKIPTCHRSSFDSVMDDQNFELVMEYSDSVSRAVYRNEAKVIEELRTAIIEVSSKEEPYDIFICYKENDASGERTIDSVIAQDVYDALTEKGYRVFFARISLEDKIGQEYEPYIFAALNSAKVMLVFGTNYENFNAVWVKNEWNRFLSMIEKGEKKTLIPCYKNIDAYDIPKEFKKLQAQDMGKIGALQDLVRGVDKIIGKKIEHVTVSNNMMPNYAPEPIKKASVISNVSAIGTNDENDLWPQGRYSSVFNLNQFSVVFFHISTRTGVLTHKSMITLHIKIYNNNDLLIYDRTSELNWAPSFTRASTGWIIRGSDGTYVPEGKYLTEISLDDCEPFKFYFTVTSDANPLDQESRQYDQSYSYMPDKAYDESRPTFGFVLLSVFIPLVGLIMGIIFMAQGQKKAGIAYLITAIMFTVLPILMLIFAYMINP